MKFWKLYFVETCVIVMQTLIMNIIELLLHDLSLLLSGPIQGVSKKTEQI
jgi:hypothetical protein